MGNIATLASVYHKPPSMFVPSQQGISDERRAAESESEEEQEDYGYGDEDAKEEAPAQAGVVDLLGMDLLSMDSPAPSASTPQLPQLLAADAGHGLQVNGQLARVNGTTVLQIQIGNVSCQTPAQSFAVMFNKNNMSLGPVNSAFQLSTVATTGGTGNAVVPLSVQPNLAKTDAPAPFVEAALKDLSSNNVLYFRLPLPLEAALVEDGRMEQGPFVQQWKANTNDTFVTISNITLKGVQDSTDRLQALNMSFVAQRAQANDVMAYYSMKTLTGVEIMAELTFRRGVNAARLNVKTGTALYIPFVQKAIQQALTA